MAFTSFVSLLVITTLHLIMLPKVVAGLTQLARYAVQPSWALVITGGSVVDFSYQGDGKAGRAAIVNAANEGCLGGGGVDGAISNAGGPSLLADRRALPEVAPGKRCPTGQAVITGPGSYGSLRVPYVIHAVGPNYMMFDWNLKEGDRLLMSAYRESLERAKEAKLEAVAFSLISSGIFRGERSKKDVLKLGMETICDFDGYEELREVHMCAYNSAETTTLQDIAAELGLKEAQ